GAKLEAGYKIVFALADDARGIAENYLACTDEIKASHTGLTGHTFRATLGLAIRAFSGLLPKQLESRSDMERLTLQIERMPSHSWRVFLWSDLALRFFRTQRSDDGKRLLNQRIRPL